jgi:hypothetical protein
MKRNMGIVDRTIRFVVGVTVISYGLYVQSWWWLIGFIPLATAIINWCPLYAIFGIKTYCKKGQDHLDGTVEGDE